MKKTVLIVAITTLFSFSAMAQQQIVAESYFLHDRTAVSDSGDLIMSSNSHPIYKQLKGLLPIDWSLAFTEQHLAIAPLAWQKGDSWTDVLDRWGHNNHANVMIDGKRKQIVASPEQNKRPAGVVFVYSGNDLHQELYRPEQRYNEAEQYVFDRLNELQGTIHDEVTVHEAQARLFDLMSDVDKKQRDLMEQRIAAKKEREKLEQKPVVKGPLTIYPSGEVSVSLTEGFLKPQFLALLKAEGKIAHEEDLIWNASENHRWPNKYELKAPSFDALISRLLATYGLRVSFTANNIAIIDYKERS